MSDGENMSHQDEEWPPKNQKRSFHAFTTKEDGLIVDYLIDRKEFRNLGGNEVWKTMSRSKKYNPAGRTYQGLRERFLKHIARRLHQFSRVTPTIKAHLLKQNPKALRDINSMKSTKQLKKDLQAPWSDEEETEDPNPNLPMTPVLVERSRIIQEHRVKAQAGRCSSTPCVGTNILPSSVEVADVVPGMVRDEVPTEVIPVQVKQEPGIEEEEEEESGGFFTAPAQDNSHLFSCSSPENSALRAGNDNQLVSHPIPCNEVMRMELTGVCPRIHFVFDAVREDVTFSFRELESLYEHREVTLALQLLHHSLRETLSAHSSHISRKSLLCSSTSCNGTSMYFILWEQLGSYLKRIEIFHQRFEGVYLKFFIRTVGEILQTPLCCTTSPAKAPTIKPEDLFEYLRSDLSKPFRETLESVQKLMQLVRAH